jgi:hypothetical protein
MVWYECGHCLAEFRVVTDSDSPVICCPLCGSELDNFDDYVDEDAIADEDFN